MKSPNGDSGEMKTVQSTERLRLSLSFTGYCFYYFPLSLLSVCLPSFLICSIFSVFRTSFFISLITFLSIYFSFILFSSPFVPSVLVCPFVSYYYFISAIIYLFIDFVFVAESHNVNCCNVTDCSNQTVDKVFMSSCKFFVHSYSGILNKFVCCDKFQ